MRKCQKSTLVSYWRRFESSFFLGVQNHGGRPFILRLIEGEELEANELKTLEAEGEETL